MTTSEAVETPRGVRQWSARKFKGVWLAAKEAGTLDLLGAAQACGKKSMSTLYDWRKGKTVPNVDQTYILAHCFGVTIEDLTEEQAPAA